MKIFTILGARPQFIKASTISSVLKNFNHKNIEEIILHTGQHYDLKMSNNFFKELNLPRPKYNLGISSLSHGEMTGKMVEHIEKKLLYEKPDKVLVYGDTNSTLAGALAASKLSIPVYHVEAGIRSYNKSMPEEINRILTDNISSYLFCPNKLSKNNLHKENIFENVFVVGDVMYDLFLKVKTNVNKKFNLGKYNLSKKKYIICTIHREANTSNAYNLTQILEALTEIAKETKVVIPLHPRTFNCIKKNKISHYLNNFSILEPLSYFDMMGLLMNCSLLITDSGGLQKEAYFNRIGCFTLRNDTEWQDTLDNKANILVGNNKNRIIREFYKIHSNKKKFKKNIFGNGNAADKIVKHLINEK